MLGDNIEIIDAALAGISLLARVSAEYEERGLQLPYVPDQLAPSIQQLNDRYFFSSEASLPLPLDFIPAWMGAALAPEDDEQKQLMGRDFLFFGESGYGVNSCFYYYYLHLGPVYLFCIRPYGGVYQDEAAAAARINTDQAAIARAFAQPPAARDGIVAIVADSKTNRNGWAAMTADGWGDWHDGALEVALGALAPG